MSGVYVMFAFGLCGVLLKCLLLTVCLDKSSLALRRHCVYARERAVFHSHYSCRRAIKSHIRAFNGPRSTTDSFNVSNKTILPNAEISRHLYACNPLGYRSEMNLRSCKMWVGFFRIPKTWWSFWRALRRLRCLHKSRGWWRLCGVER